ncbi:unnamed protein product [Tuber aestivum]|uniref:Uncharacterized protein n=1 Tax=Tuber aestivum TaxID=59557 RepID=A0A292PUH9_9PEZI|nr:unnamed protein product [Tuber aestivum]
MDRSTRTQRADDFLRGRASEGPPRRRAGGLPSHMVESEISMTVASHPLNYRRPNCCIGYRCSTVREDQRREGERVRFVSKSCAMNLIWIERAIRSIGIFSPPVPRLRCNMNSIKLPNLDSQAVQKISDIEGNKDGGGYYRYSTGNVFYGLVHPRMWYPISLYAQGFHHTHNCMANTVQQSTKLQLHLEKKRWSSAAELGDVFGFPSPPLCCFKASFDCEHA